MAAFTSAIIFDGIIFSFGIFLSDLASHFNEGLGKTAWIGSTISAVYALVGPIASLLENKFGCRVVTISGSVLSATGFVLSTFSPNIWVMVLTYGFMAGIGFGLMYHCAFVMVGHYFEKRRALATGITACGSGVGTFIFAQIGSIMLHSYGWKGSMWLLAGISLQGVVVGCCYRPIDAPHNNNANDDNVNNKVIKKEYPILSLLKSPSFLVFCFSSFLCLIGFMIPFIYLPNYALQIGASEWEASFLVSIIGITNTLGRILCGWICDKSWADPLKIYNGALIIGGSATVACAWMKLYVLQAIYAAVFGLCVAFYVSLCAIIIIEFLGLEKLSSAFGFLNMCRGVATLIGAPIAGNLYDTTGRFDLTFYTAGSSIIAAGVICLPLRLMSQCAQKHSNKKQGEALNEKCISSLEHLRQMDSVA